MSIRIFATLFIAALSMTVSVTAQESSQVEVKTDRFSNTTKVTLKPQTILKEPDNDPDHLITMRIETALTKKAFDDTFRDSVDAKVYIESHSKVAVEFGDGKINLLVDGRPLSVPPGEIEFDPLINKPKPGFKTYRSGIILFDRAALEKIEQAKQVEMRIGSI